jgi:hypothetical protein
MRAWRLLPWLVTYAVAMAYVESAVVVYLRAPVRSMPVFAGTSRCHSGNGA